mmetsp:Transcript_18299/g.16587  ORF Transcript_18299/g.16587 Transcript_18299/m.16587 type:complete len:81 (+) Transcript_18299:200-442(+)
MADSELSASELRKRYHRGGILKDDELNAQQLRARHGIPSNRNDYSAEKESSGQSSNHIIGLIIVVILIIGGFVLYKLKDI